MQSKKTCPAVSHWEKELRKNKKQKKKKNKKKTNNNNNNKKKQQLEAQVLFLVEKDFLQFASGKNTTIIR